ncbi:MAG: glycosyltransferase family protein, partial [bacterium]
GLREILDDPATTTPIWKSNGYFETIRDFYDQIWIYGDRTIFDTVKEYQMPAYVAKKAVFTGYLAKTPSNCDRLEVRAELGLNGGLFSLVMVGGGGDGYPIMKTYIDSVRDNKNQKLESLLISGPEMPKEKRREVEHFCSNGHPVQFKEFSDEIEKYLKAADVVVSMGGYNSTSEILALRKKAVIIPRVFPVSEQYIRTKRLAELGLVNMIAPKDLSSKTFLDTVERTALQDELQGEIEKKIDLHGLRRITDAVRGFLPKA